MFARLCSTYLPGFSKFQSGANRLRRSASLSLHNQRGGALVEFALVLPMFMLLTTGILSFGFALNNYLELTNAVNIGAQSVGLSRSSTLTDPCSVGATAIQNAVPQLNSSNIAYTFAFTPAATASDPTPTATSYSGSSCTAQAASMTQGGSVQVTATYPCTLTVYGNNFGCNLQAEVTEMIQ